MTKAPIAAFIASIISYACGVELGLERVIHEDGQVVLKLPASGAADLLQVPLERCTVTDNILAVSLADLADQPDHLRASGHLGFFADLAPFPRGSAVERRQAPLPTEA